MKNDLYLSGFVCAFFEDYLVCRRYLCQNTIRSYRDAIKLFIGHVVDRLRKRPTRLLVADITDELVVGFLEARIFQMQCSRWHDTCVFSL